LLAVFVNSAKNAFQRKILQALNYFRKKVGNVSNMEKYLTISG